MSEDRVRRWIESGKQVGAKLDAQIQGRPFFVVVGVQRWEGRIKVCVTAIAETMFAMDEYARDEVVDFGTIDEAAAYVGAHTPATFSELRPGKGLRYFDPSQELGNEATVGYDV